MMNQPFTASDYARISALVFQPDYPGFTPGVVESPNGDGKLDTEKRYAHVAEKYLITKRTISRGQWVPDLEHNNRVDILNGYLDRAHNLALEVAIAIGVPKPFWPSRKYSALRVLEYGPTAVTHPHTDFDLFTLMCYRNQERFFRFLPSGNEATEQSVRWYRHDLSERVSKLNSQIHFGELIELLDPAENLKDKIWRADKHEVVASNGPWQYSCVFFAVPDHEAALPSGMTVGDWMDERKKRSRYER